MKDTIKIITELNDIEIIENKINKAKKLFF